MAGAPHPLRRRLVRSRRYHRARDRSGGRCPPNPYEPPNTTGSNRRGTAGRWGAWHGMGSRSADRSAASAWRVPGSRSRSHRSGDSGWPVGSASRCVGPAACRGSGGRSGLCCSPAGAYRHRVLCAPGWSGVAARSGMRESAGGCAVRVRVTCRSPALPGSPAHTHTHRARQVGGVSAWPSWGSAGLLRGLQGYSLHFWGLVERPGRRLRRAHPSAPQTQQCFPEPSATSRPSVPGRPRRAATPVCRTTRWVGSQPTRSDHPVEIRACTGPTMGGVSCGVMPIPPYVQHYGRPPIPLLLRVDQAEPYWFLPNEGAGA